MHSINTILRMSSVVLMLVSVFFTLLTLFRYRKPTIYLISLEVLANLFISGICLWALYLKQVLFLDLCLAISLIMFLSTAAYCQYLIDQKEF